MEFLVFVGTLFLTIYDVVSLTRPVKRTNETLKYIFIYSPEVI